MDDLLLGCFAMVVAGYLLLVPGIAVFLALKARRETSDLRRQLEEDRALTARLDELRARPHPISGPGPAASAPPAVEPPVSPPPVPVAPEDEPTGELHLAGAAGPGVGPGLAPAPASPTPPPSSAARPAAAPPEPAAAPTPAEKGAARRREPGLEERLGARLPVWIGGIALALAGAFLVQYSVERGWLSPAVRVALALVFGIALLVGGELLRAKSGRIAQALSAAGVADLYAALFAAVRLYDLISPGVGFALMAANTAVAVGLALRQGPMPAALGLVGGFLTPALVSTGERNVAGLVAYLFLLDLGLVAVTRRRRWPALAGAALAASLLWVAIWLAGSYRAGDGVALGLFLVASGALFAGLASRSVASGERPWGNPVAERAIAFAAGAGGLALLGLVVRASGFGWAEWGTFALLGAGCLALARLREAEQFTLAPLAATLTLALLVLWGNDLVVADEERFLWVVAGAVLLYAVVPYLLARHAVRPERWCALAAAAWIALPLVAALSCESVADAMWAALFAVLAAGAVAGALPLARRFQEEATEARGLALAWLAASATAALSLAFAFALEREWLSVALALEVPALYALAGRLRLATLRRLALALAAVAAARLLFNPEVLRYPIGATPIWNLLLWGYGVPALGLFAAARLARSQEVTREAEWLEWGSVAFALAGGTLEVWHFFSPEAPADALAKTGLAAWTCQTALWLVAALGLLVASRRWPGSAFRLGGRWLLALGGLAALAVHSVSENPAYARGPVGELPVVNLLLAAFALPALLLLAGARLVERAGAAAWAVGLRLAALVLAFVWATLEARHAFRGSYLAAGDASAAERFTYSAVWVLLGCALLVAGVLRGERGLRLGALGVMLLAVLKVFLLDTAALTGLYRVASFLGLGFSLLGLAWLYQRFVFRREEEEA